MVPPNSGEVINSRNSGKGKKTPKVVSALSEAISRGLPFKTACVVAGISMQTFCVWRREDPEFDEAIESAKAEGISSRMKKIEEAAAAGDWRAAAWLLEHCDPELFAKTRIQIEQTGVVEHVHTIPKEILDEITKARGIREARQRDEQATIDIASA